MRKIEMKWSCEIFPRLNVLNSRKLKIWGVGRFVRDYGILRTYEYWAILSHPILLVQNRTGVICSLNITGVNGLPGWDISTRLFRTFSCHVGYICGCRTQSRGNIPASKLVRTGDSLTNKKNWIINAVQSILLYVTLQNNLLPNNRKQTEGTITS